MDIFHANSLEWMHHGHLVGKHPLYDLSNILICMRHQDRIAVLNWPRKEIVWAWGWEEISGPHDAHMLENGHILLFDNGIVQRRSRAVELDPVSGEIVWGVSGRSADFVLHAQPGLRAALAERQYAVGRVGQGAAPSR